MAVPLLLITQNPYPVFFGAGILTFGVGYFIGKKFAPPPYDNIKFLLFGIGPKIPEKGVVPEEPSNIPPWAIQITNPVLAFVPDHYFTDAQNAFRSWYQKHFDPDDFRLDGVAALNETEKTALVAAFGEWASVWGADWRPNRCWKMFKAKKPNGSLAQFTAELHSLVDPVTWTSAAFPHPAPIGRPEGGQAPTIPGVPMPPAGGTSNDFPPTTDGPAPPAQQPVGSPSVQRPVAGQNNVPSYKRASDFSNVDIVENTNTRHAWEMARRIESAWIQYKERYRIFLGGQHDWSLEDFWAAYWTRIPGASKSGFAAYLEAKTVPNSLIVGWAQ